MTESAATQRSPSNFPTPSEAVKYGWRFFTNNVWSVVAYVGFSAVLVGIMTPFLDRIDGDDAGGSLLVDIVVVFVVALVGLVLELGLWRRALDYWDETSGLVAPRSTSQALSTAFEGAKPRLWPYVGWTLVLAAIVVAGIVLAAIIVDAVGPVVAIVLLAVMLVLFYLFDFLTSFFSIAVADGPDNPITRSIHVFRGHFWRIVGTYLLLGLFLVLGAIPVAILLAIFDGSTATAVIEGIGVGLLAIVFLGIGAGATAVMYRSVYGSSAASHS